MDDTEFEMNEQKGRIKLTKNSKGYNWDVKVQLGDEPELTDFDKVIQRIDEINKVMRDKFQ